MQLYCSEALGLLRDPGDQSLESLIKAMNEVAPHQAIEIMRSMLDRVFLGEPMPQTATAARLSADQGAVLRAVSTSEKIWHDLHGRVLNLSVIEIMKEFGLPANVVRLQAFLEGRMTPQDSDWSKAMLAPAKPPAKLGELMRKLVEEADQFKKSSRNRPPDRDRD